MISNAKTKQNFHLKSAFFSLVGETWLTSWELIKITIPVVIITKILEEFGMIGYLGMVLEPVMGLIGLPGPLGLVWATAMITNLYGGIAIFAALAPGLDLSSAQITILCSAMLIAHSLPIELSVSKRAGANLLPIAIIRLFGAVLYAFILNFVCQHFELWQEKAVLIFNATAASASLGQWAVEQIRNQGLIVAIIFCIILIMRLFKVLGILDLLEKLLAPFLPAFGMGRQAAPITVVGMIMGIGYGGALIIRETSTGKLNREEVFNSMALMGLCHGLIEDTLIMMAIGGKVSGILWGRIVFSLLVTFALVRVMRILRRRRECAQKL